jgi:hypothetical protein
MKQQFESARNQLKRFIPSLHMTFDNALHEAERLDGFIKYYAGCTVCGCTVFDSFRFSRTDCKCGHTLEQHQCSIASAIRVMPRHLFYIPDGRKKIITLAVHGHGCDIPFPLFKYEETEARRIIPRTHVMSAVPHGCIIYYPSNVLSFIQREFMDPTEEPYKSMQSFSDKISADVAVRQLDDTLLKIDPSQPELMELRDAFKKLPREKLYFLHTPLAERRYDFVKTQADMDEKKDEFGVFVVQSTYPDDVVLIDYSASTVLECNNLISDRVHRSLHKYVEPIRFYEPQYKQKLTLQQLLKSVFAVRPDLEHLNIIDLGCRTECSPLPFDPRHADRIYPSDYMAELPASAMPSVTDVTAATATATVAISPSSATPAAAQKADSAQGKRKRKTQKRKRARRRFKAAK